MSMMNQGLVQFAPVKDSRWLTLEVCREYQRNKCTRTEVECKFAHPPAHVEVQNGRVVCCYDSIKGKCQRKEPPCKYLHPPQHLREQLLQNGRNNLIIKNIQMQMLSQSLAAAGGQLMPITGQLINTASAPSYHSFLGTSGLPMMATAGDPLIGAPGSQPPTVSVHNGMNGSASSSAMKLDSRDCLPAAYKRPPVADNKSGIPVYQPASFQQITAFPLPSGGQTHGQGAFIPTSCEF